MKRPNLQSHLFLKKLTAWLKFYAERFGVYYLTLLSSWYSLAWRSILFFMGMNYILLLLTCCHSNSAYALIFFLTANITYQPSEFFSIRVTLQTYFRAATTGSMYFFVCRRNCHRCLSYKIQQWSYYWIVHTIILYNYFFPATLLQTAIVVVFTFALLEAEARHGAVTVTHTANLFKIKLGKNESLFGSSHKCKLQSNSSVINMTDCQAWVPKRCLLQACQ